MFLLYVFGITDQFNVLPPTERGQIVRKKTALLLSTPTQYSGSKLLFVVIEGFS